MFAVALLALSSAAHLLGDEHELGFFSGRLSAALWRYPEVTRRGVQMAWLVWAVLFGVAASPLDPIATPWDEVALGAVARLSFGTGSSAGTEPSIEVGQSLVQADDGWIEFAHGHGQSVLGEVVRRHVTRLGDELDRSNRRLVVSVGQHVEVGVRHPAIIQTPDGVGQAAVAQAVNLHQSSQSLPEGFSAVDHVFRITR